MRPSTFAALIIGAMACTAAKQEAAGDTYTLQLLKCVDMAHTLAESKACRARVDAEWGRVDAAPPPPPAPAGRPYTVDEVYPLDGGDAR